MDSVIIAGLAIDFFGALIIALAESSTAVAFITMGSRWMGGKLGQIEKGLDILGGKDPAKGLGEHEELVPNDTDESFVTELREGDPGFDHIKSVIRRFRGPWSIPFYIDAIIVVSAWESEEWEVKPYDGKWTGDFDKKTRRGYEIAEEQRKHRILPTLVYAEGEHWGTHTKETIASWEKLKEWINRYSESKIRRWGLVLLLIGFGLQIVGYILV